MKRKVSLLTAIVLMLTVLIVPAMAEPAPIVIGTISPQHRFSGRLWRRRDDRRRSGGGRN